MTVKELIDKLKEFDEDLEVYVSIYNEVIGQLVDDKKIREAKLGTQVYFDRENKPCVILS